MINIIQSFIEEKGFFIALNKIKNDFESGKMQKVFFIVPEQFTLEAEKMMIDNFTANGLLNIEVLSIKRLTNRILMNTTSSLPKVLDASGKSMVIKHITNKLKNELDCFNLISNRYSFNENLCELFTELKKQEVSFENLENDNQNNFFYKKTNDIKKLYEEYNAFLGDNIFDTNDLISFAANKAKYATFLKGSQIIYFGFDVFDQNIYSLIESLMSLNLEQSFIFNTNKSGNSSNAKTYSIVNNTINIIESIAEEKNIEVQKETDDSNHLKEDLDFLAKNLFSFGQKEYDGEIKNITVAKNNTIYDEVEFVAKEIIRLVRDENVRFNDIMVLPSDFEVYSDIIKDVFTKNDINFFLDSTTNIDDTNVIRAIIKILDIVNYDFSTKDIIAFLKTNLTPLTKDEIETLENYTLEFNINYGIWLKEFIYNNELDEYDLDKLNENKAKFINPILNLRENLKNKKTAGEMTKELYSFLVEYKIESKIRKIKEDFEKKGDYLNSNKYAQIYNKIITTLEQIYDFLGDIELDLGEYIDILKYGFSSVKIGVLPESVDKVSILTLQRSRKTSIKYLFVLGVNEGKLPNAFNEGGIYTDKEKHFAIENGINLRSTREYKQTEEKYFLTSLIAKTGEHLYLTYSLHDKNSGELIPSFIINKTLKIFPDMEEQKLDITKENDNLFLVTNYKGTFENLITNLNENNSFWHRVKKAYNKEIDGIKYISLLNKAQNFRNKAKIESKKVKQKLENNSLRTSITQLEMQASCPFRYFVRYALKPQEKRESKVKPIDTGNVIHEVINEFSNMIMSEEINVKEISNTDIEGIANNLISTKIESFKEGKFKKQANSKFFKSKLFNETNLAFKQIIRQLRNSNFKLTASEATLESLKDKKSLILTVDENNKVQLTGKIDRIDTFDAGDLKYVKVIDYKTSALKKYDLTENYYGISMQLPLYLKAITDEKTLPAGAFYFKVIEPAIEIKNSESLTEVEKLINKELKIDGMLLDDIDIFNNMDTNLNDSYINFSFKGKGRKKDTLFTKEEFNSILNYTENKCIKLLQDIKNLKIDIAPYSTDLCKYCNYRNICKFEKTFNKINEIDTIKKKEFFKKLQEEEENELD